MLGNGWPGVLLHEAVGHGLEGDFNRKGTSAFSGRVGEQVASKGVTVVDNGTMQDRRGSLTIDDEGVQTQCTTLIEDGILKGYMQDKMNAGLMGVESTGNGRRESYDSLPMPRMTNTYMLAGERDPQEIIESGAVLDPAKIEEGEEVMRRNSRITKRLIDDLGVSPGCQACENTRSSIGTRGLIHPPKCRTT